MEVFDMPELKELRHPGIVAAKKAAALKPKPESVRISGDRSSHDRQGTD
jgi:hypothetical protein